jgi:hypothetical protein
MNRLMEYTVFSAVFDDLVLRGLTDKALAAVGERHNNGRSGPAPSPV